MIGTDNERDRQTDRQTETDRQKVFRKLFYQHDLIMIMMMMMMFKMQLPSFQVNFWVGGFIIHVSRSFDMAFIVLPRNL